MAQWQMSETNMDSYIEEMYEEEPVLTQKDIIQQLYAEIPNEVNHDISVEELKFLITLRVSYSTKILSAKKKGKKFKLWELILNKIAEKGYSFSPKVCDEKWHRLSTQHRKYYNVSKKSGNNAIKWQYFKLMDEAIIPLGKKTVHISSKSIERNKRLDKLEKREHEMLEVQKQLVDKLNTANDIEIQKLDMFKKMFKID
ncbi:hypothetical protein QTP88_018894 [Uroleucon formosanum]